MRKVITYGTYDLLHYGHERLLKRAKELGDYLIVGVTSDNYDRVRGKLNNTQSLGERISAIQATGLADQIIVEEYEGQKIDDILHFQVDVFAIGSDWEGKFDYLRDYCEVVYLERTAGISSTQLRAEERMIELGLVGGQESKIFDKYYNSCQYANGAKISAICSSNPLTRDTYADQVEFYTEDYEDLLNHCEAVCLISHPELHYEQIKMAIEKGKHVLCESPITLRQEQTEELFHLAREKQVVLMDAVKTAYQTAYNRLIRMLQGNKIGKIVSIETTCTSLEDQASGITGSQQSWSSMCAWGPTAMLPVFQILGTEYQDSHISSYLLNRDDNYDAFSKIDFYYPNAVASCKVGRGAKSEGSMIISGTEGYVYVPAPWWKMDYFEFRFEDANNNQRFFYQLKGEGIRHQLIAFLQSIKKERPEEYMEDRISVAISRVMEQYYTNRRLNLT